MSIYNVFGYWVKMYQQKGHAIILATFILSGNIITGSSSPLNSYRETYQKMPNVTIPTSISLA